jgi:hypothetical protein
MKFRKHVITLLKLLRPLIQKKQYYKALNAFILWRLKNIPDKAFTLFLCLVVGVLSGISAALIKNSVHFVEWLLTADIAEDQDSILCLLSGYC